MSNTNIHRDRAHLFNVLLECYPFPFIYYFFLSNYFGYIFPANVYIYTHIYILYIHVYAHMHTNT